MSGIAAALLLGGVSLTLIAAVGLHRFGDVYARMHAATKAATAGLILVVVAAGFRLEDRGDISKLALVVALQVVTAPVAAHAVGRAAYRSGPDLSAETEVDELATAGKHGNGRP